MVPASATPPLSDFVSRRFAEKSPFWSWTIFEPVGGALAYVFARLRTPPAAATLAGGVAGITGATLLGTATERAHLVVAGALLLLAYSLDCSDGQLARATNRASARGAWLDVSVDSVVIAFVSASLCLALAADGAQGAGPLLLAGAFGASRTASLFTSTVIRRDHGGMQLSGLKGVLRRTYTATIDTPLVYVALCASRLELQSLRAVMVAVTILTVGQTVVSARHHFNFAARSTA